MKSKTQNIYNFSMERKNVKENTRKWKLFFIVLAKKPKKKPHRGESYKNTVISAIVANSCSLQQRRVNKYLESTRNWSRLDEPPSF